MTKSFRVPFFALMLGASLLPGTRAQAQEDPLKRARELTREKNFAQALEIFQTLVAQDPNDYILLKEAAKISGWAGSYALSLEWYHRVLQRYPRDIDSKLGQGLVLSWKGDYAEAIGVFDEILRDNADYLDAYASKARVLAWQGSYDQSEAVYMRALSRFPDEESLLQGLLQLYRWSHNGEKGAALAERLLKDNPDDLNLIVFLAIFYRDAGDTSKAIATFEMALAKQDRPDFRAELGHLYAKNLQLDLAVTELKKALAARAGNVDDYMSLGRVLSYQKKVEESIQFYRQALEINPDNLDAVNGMARTYLYAKQWKKSEATFRRVLEKDPHNRDAIEGLNRLKSFSAPRVTWGYRFQDVADKNAPGAAQARPFRDSLFEGQYVYKLDPDRSVEVYSAWGLSHQVDPNRSFNPDFLISRSIFGLGLSWQFKGDLSLFGRLDLNHYEDIGAKALELRPITLPSGFGVFQWSPGNHRIAITLAKDLFIDSDSSSNTADIDSISSYALSEDWEVTDRLSLFLQLGFDKSSTFSPGRPEYLARTRYRIPWRGIWQADYQYSYATHDIERKHKVFLTYKNTLGKRFTYQIAYAPEWHEDDKRTGHDFSTFCSYQWTEGFHSVLNLSYTENTNAFFGKTWVLSSSMEWRL